MEIIHLAPFTASSRGLFDEQGLFELELALMLNPLAGDVIPGGRGLRKLRRPLPGRGKRGGSRVICYHVAADASIYLVFAYAKNQQGDLTTVQLRQLVGYLQTQLP